jgi:hypothetical protein
VKVPTRIRSSSDAPPVDQEQLRAARREAARANAYWQELEEPALVRRAMFFVHAADDTIWSFYRGTVWDPGSANVVFNDRLPMWFYVDAHGDVVFLERRPGLWSDIVARQAQRRTA